MNDSKQKNLKRILAFLPHKISEVLKNIVPEQIDELCEIRIRADSAVVLIFVSDRKFITEGGRLTSMFSSDLMKMSVSEIENTFNMLCEYSMHSHMDSISNGFITIDGGNRIGLYGTAVTEKGRIVSVRSIKGLNIRISGTFYGVAAPVAELFRKSPVNTLICGPPSSGKTTMLRDLSRLLSDEYGYKVAVIDERCEIGGYQLGYNTDVLSRYPKAKGIETAVRTLSPEIIICDEIGTTDEVTAITDGLNCGVCFVMTIHCRNFENLSLKPQFKSLMAAGAVDSCVLLESSKCRISEIKAVEEIGDENCRIDGIGDSMLPCRAVHSLHP